VDGVPKVGLRRGKRQQGNVHYSHAVFSSERHRNGVDVTDRGDVRPLRIAPGGVYSSATVRVLPAKDEGLWRRAPNDLPDQGNWPSRGLQRGHDVT
jgi:hypothetical protein